MTGVLLLNLGAPDSLDAVQPFLYNLFSDKDIIRFPFFQKGFAAFLSRLRAKKVMGRYELMGGKSPLLDITLEQASALEKRLNGYRTYVGMRYWRPFIGEAVARMIGDGIARVILLPLYPQYSIATTGSCLAEYDRETEKQNADLETLVIDQWSSSDLYLQALSETVVQGLGGWKLSETHILFSAHGLPVKLIEQGDPYADQVCEAVESVAGLVGTADYSLSFQGKVGPMKWLEPDTRDAIDRLAADGCKSLLMVPVSFVSDHVETLYEMDIMYRNQAEGLGIAFRRAPALGTRPSFVNALADIVNRAAMPERRCS